MKATNIKATGNNDKWMVTATVNNIDYQQRFNHEPNRSDVNAAVESFEQNYAGLNESNNKPSKVNKHHFNGE